MSTTDDDDYGGRKGFFSIQAKRIYIYIYDGMTMMITMMTMMRRWVFWHTFAISHFYCSAASEESEAAEVMQKDH
jgi:hypothetical protein